MKQLSDQFPRFGYRRILVFLEQLGHVMGPDKALRLWQRAGLQVPRKRPRKRVAHSRPRPQLPSGANEVWAYDFVHDACANGQQLKCLTIIDEYTRECLAIDVAGSIRSNRVIEILSRLVSERGAPHRLRSDNGPEFVSKALLRWVANRWARSCPDRSRQALAKRHGRELQRQIPGRMPLHGMVSLPDGSQSGHRGLAQDLQRSAAAFESRQNDPEGLCSDARQYLKPRSHPQELTGPKNAGRSDAAFSESRKGL